MDALDDGSGMQHPSGLRVLVVDDNRDAAAMMAALVQSWGHSAIIAHSAPEALKVAQPFRPRVVLLDLGLPDRHGYDLADGLRHQADKRKIFFVAVTGWTHLADQVRAKAAGISHHLVKPVNHETLRQILAVYAVSYEEIGKVPPTSPLSAMPGTVSRRN